MRCIVYLTALFAGVHSQFSLTEEEKDCLAKKEVLYNGKCYRLGTRGPCESGQILIPNADKILREDWTGQIEMQCQENECEEDKMFWPETETCVSEGDFNEICGTKSGRILIMNEFGNAECTCKRSPIHVQMKTGSNDICYPMFHKGPCSDKFVVGFTDDSDSGEATCIPDKCYHEKKRRELLNILDSEDILVQWTDGKCYELDTHGPCQNSEVFEINTSLQVGCSAHTLSFFVGVGKRVDCNGKDCNQTAPVSNREMAVQNQLNYLKQKVHLKRNQKRDRSRSNGKK